MNRRQLLQLMAAGLTTWNLPLSWAGQQQRPKLVWVMLRGGMDSLHALLPLADDDLRRHRGNMVAAVEKGAHSLEHGFALHPALKQMYKLYQNQEMSAVVATASAQRTRSHFMAQDILECGLPTMDHQSGWLNRAVDAFQGESLAVAHSTPISLRGQRLAKTWYPDTLPEAKDDLYERLAGLYENDSLLYSRLLDGLATREQLGEMEEGKSARRFSLLAESCATLMSQSQGPDCAMLEMGGWDTHNNALTRLNRQFQELDRGIAKLKQGLGKQWAQTVVVVASEFGRTVAENGTKGTDHGTAGALFLAGGALNGGKVLGEWPGLAKADQYERRDLRPTSDIRQWLSTVLSQHWSLREADLQRVFPGVRPVGDRLILS